MASNGRLPASALRPIPGGMLRTDAALRWNAMCFYLRAHGRAIPMPNGPASSYRTFAQQVVQKHLWCARGHCENAATPGTSNHGLGIAVDTNQGAIVDSVPQFGFDRRFSDAPWESWHRKWGGFGLTVGGAPRLEDTVVRRGSRGAAVKYLTVLLRGAGYLPGSYRATVVFRLRVRRAVREFQRKHNMQVDGVVGPATWRAIRAAYDRRQH